MAETLVLHPDRLFPAEPTVRALARELHAGVRDLPILSPHGHTDPRWFATDAPWTDATSLLLAPDHYLFRMLRSWGVPLERLGVPDREGRVHAEPRAAWRLFAEHWRLFRGTPSALWLDQTFAEVFGLQVRLGPDTADLYFDRIGEALATPALRPRALFERFGVELLATTESAVDPLEAHRALRAGGWPGRVITTYRPDAVIDPEHEEFQASLDAFSALTGEDARSWRGYLEAHRRRRADFRALGAVATDHGHVTAATADLSSAQAEALFDRVQRGAADAGEAESFRAQMLTEMARLSVDDGMVMQLHPGSFRNHDARLFARFGRDRGADLPLATDYVSALRPLLNRFGDAPGFSLIAFTLDETAYARELAPLAGVYPALRLGPAWWFNDSPEGMRRFREQTTETAGFFNTVGFNDDTRAFLSIPSRHDMARRCDCAFLARLVAEHRMTLDEAHDTARRLTRDLVLEAYKLAPEAGAPARVAA